MSGIICRRALVGCSLAPLREIKSLKGKSNASARWVRRQWSDPIVKQAKREGLRSRAALKLRELNTVCAARRYRSWFDTCALLTAHGHLNALVFVMQLQKYQLVRKGDVVLDLGAAPGGWTQVCHFHIA